MAAPIKHYFEALHFRDQTYSFVNKALVLMLMIYIYIYIFQYIFQSHARKTGRQKLEEGEKKKKLAL